MVLGLRDYVNKNRFPGVVLGLSGGIDSALSAAVAVDALGAERVRCVMMPSRYTSQRQPRGRRGGARSCSAAATTSSPSRPPCDAFAEMLDAAFGGTGRRHRPRRTSSRASAA